mgnify:CR=1 FL=1
MQEQLEKELGKMCASASHSAKHNTHSQATTAKLAGNNGPVLHNTYLAIAEFPILELHRRADIGGTEVLLTF